MSSTPEEQEAEESDLLNVAKEALSAKLGGLSLSQLALKKEELMAIGFLLSRSYSGEESQAALERELGLQTPLAAHLFGAILQGPSLASVGKVLLTFTMIMKALPSTTNASNTRRVVVLSAAPNARQQEERLQTWRNMVLDADKGLPPGVKHKARFVLCKSVNGWASAENSSKSVKYKSTTSRFLGSRGGAAGVVSSSIAPQPTTINMLFIPVSNLSSSRKSTKTFLAELMKNVHLCDLCLVDGVDAAASSGMVDTVATTDLVTPLLQFVLRLPPRAMRVSFTDTTPCSASQSLVMLHIITVKSSDAASLSDEEDEENSDDGGMSTADPTQQPELHHIIAHELQRTLPTFVTRFTPLLQVSTSVKSSGEQKQGSRRPRRVGHASYKPYKLNKEVAAFLSVVDTFSYQWLNTPLQLTPSVTHFVPTTLKQVDASKLISQRLASTPGRGGWWHHGFANMRKAVNNDNSWKKNKFLEENVDDDDHTLGPPRPPVAVEEGPLDLPLDEGTHHPLVNDDAFFDDFMIDVSDDVLDVHGTLSVGEGPGAVGGTTSPPTNITPSSTPKMEAILQLLLHDDNATKNVVVCTQFENVAVQLATFFKQYQHYFAVHCWFSSSSHPQRTHNMQNDATRLVFIATSSFVLEHPPIVWSHDTDPPPKVTMPPIFVVHDMFLNMAEEQRVLQAAVGHYCNHLFGAISSQASTVHQFVAEESIESAMLAARTVFKSPVLLPHSNKEKVAAFLRKTVNMILFGTPTTNKRNNAPSAAPREEVPLSPEDESHDFGVEEDTTTTSTTSPPPRLIVGTGAFLQEVAIDEELLQEEVDALRLYAVKTLPAALEDDNEWSQGGDVGSGGGGSDDLDGHSDDEDSLFGWVEDAAQGIAPYQQASTNNTNKEKQRRPRLRSQLVALASAFLASSQGNENAVSHHTNRNGSVYEQTQDEDTDDGREAPSSSESVDVGVNEEMEGVSSSEIHNLLLKL